MFEKNSDEGVSPVVGVILMVAITVILSAIIATFVLDLGGTVSQNPQAGVTFDQSPDDQAGTDSDTNGFEVAVQVVSMENADYVEIYGSSDVSGDNVDANGDGQFNELENVGDTALVEGVSDGDKITVNAALEGKTQVIQTYTIDG